MRPIGSARRTWRIRVDPTRCSGRGLCAEMLPELISLDDWGFPIMSEEALGATLLRHARRTVAACPELALFLEAVPNERGNGGPWPSRPSRPRRVRRKVGAGDS